MRLLPRAAAAGLLLALLTWLLVRGLSTNSAEYSATLRIFDDFALAEASLHRDVLRARAGLLQDYDPVNADMAQTDSAAALLRLQALKAGLDAAPVDRLAALTKLEEELTERFKSDNALLRNSLSYVGLFEHKSGLRRTESSDRPVHRRAGGGDPATHCRFFAAVQSGGPESPC